MKRKTKVIYYSDELNEDFAGTNITQKVVDEKFKYIHKNPVWNMLANALYYIVAVPLVWIYMRIILRVKFVNKKAIKKIKRPYFLYGNHTGFIDAFIPNLISLPKRNRIIVSPDTVSIKGLKNITQMLGAIPTPSDMRGMRNFMNAINFYHDKDNITIYPEAHIWPYFTKVRNFSDKSFAYPAKSDAPVVAFFTAYTKPKGFLSFLRKANVMVFVSDPIYVEHSKTGKDAQKDLRDKVFSFMLEKSQFSDYEVIKYIKKSTSSQ